MGAMSSGWVSRFTGSVLRSESAGRAEQTRQRCGFKLFTGALWAVGLQNSLLQATELCAVLCATLLIQPRNKMKEIKTKEKQKTKEKKTVIQLFLLVACK